MKNEEIIKKLKSKNYDAPYEVINRICNRSITNEVLDTILKLKDNLVIGDFLEKCEILSERQLQRTKDFIKANLNNKDRLFVSDLIDFANKWKMRSFYEQIMLLLKNENEDGNVILSSIFYLYEQLDIEFIDELVNSLHNIVSNKNYYQNSQVAASFYLLRITHSSTYYDDLKSLVVEGQEINKQVLKNILSLPYNQQKVFTLHNKILSIIN